MALSASRVSRQPSLCYPARRRCRFRGCTTRLSIYNPDNYCTLHAAHATFDVDTLVRPRSCPSYLVDPRYHPEAFDHDELQVLEHLSAQPNQWVFFTYDGEVNARRIGNAVRRLRRKGYTIKGRKGGGYQLCDHIPYLPWKGAIRGQPKTQR